MNVSNEFVDWLMLVGAGVFALAMGLNHLALLVARRTLSVRDDGDRSSE